MPSLSGPESRFFIRRMRSSDLSSVLAIEALSFSNPWSVNTFRGEIQNTAISFPLVVVQRPGDNVVGYVIYWKIKDDVQVNNVAVHPDFRGRGIGEAMMRFVVDTVRAEGAAFITLEVRASNVAALSLYDKLGFGAMGRRKDYYTNPGEDAVVLGLSFGQ